MASTLIGEEGGQGSSPVMLLGAHDTRGFVFSVPFSSPLPDNQGEQTNHPPVRRSLCLPPPPQFEKSSSPLQTAVQSHHHQKHRAWWRWMGGDSGLGPSGFSNLGQQQQHPRPRWGPRKHACHTAGSRASCGCHQNSGCVCNSSCYLGGTFLLAFMPPPLVLLCMSIPSLREHCSQLPTHQIICPLVFC